MTGCNQLLVDDRSDIHAFCQRNIVNVLNLGYCPVNPESLGSQTSQYISTGIFRQSDECLCILDAFVHQ